MITCPNCSKDNQDHYKFCLGCGAKLVAPQPAAPVVPSAPIAPPVVAPAPAPAPVPVAVHAPAAPASGSACAKCGQQNPPGFAFCGRCGNNLKAQASATSTGTPAVTSPVAAPAPHPPQGNARTVFMDQGQAPPMVAPVAAPAAPPPARTKLILLREDGSEGGYLILDENPKTIGRAHGAPFDNDAYLDPNHATISADPGGLKVQDLNSLNGVFLRLIGKADLNHNDQFRVGQELILYTDLPEPEALPDGTERMGSPNPGYWGRLELLADPDRAVAAWAIDGEGILMGRETGDITFPEDGYVSGRHARVYGDDNGVYLEDLDSSNGTYLRVRDGQVVPFNTTLLIGQQLFRIEKP